MQLFIVESPAKCKKIQKFLPKDFVVKASVGHIRDLRKNELSIDIEDNFTPFYTILPGKGNIVSNLKQLAKKSSMVWLAPDEDREGEAIAYHIKIALNLKDSNTKRVTFNEITKTAILNAINNPRTIDMNLFFAQESRRILDRIVGFKLSPLLWKHIDTTRKGLSAGRVQSVVTKMIIEREDIINNHNSENFYKLEAEFTPLNKIRPILIAKYNDTFENKQDVMVYFNNIKNVPYTFVIKEIKNKEEKKSPPPPFTTSTLQQDCSVKFGFSPKMTMNLAQKLYDKGFITYMRTDSVSLSNMALGMIKNEVINRFGEENYKFRKYQNKSKGAQEAHECIRPTNIKNSSLEPEPEDEEYEEGTIVEQHYLDDNCMKLYKLIWNRTMSSQMEPALFDVTEVKIICDETKNDIDSYFLTRFKKIKKEGYQLVYKMSSKAKSDDEDIVLDEKSAKVLSYFKEGTEISYLRITAKETFTNAKPRFNEATLVKRLEDKQIGRPSTYASIIHVIQERNYVEKKNIPSIKYQSNTIKLEKNGDIIEKVENKKTTAEKYKLVPTELGRKVNEFLEDKFSDIMNYDFTANMENELDQVALGESNSKTVLKTFYDKISGNIGEMSKAKSIKKSSNTEEGNTNTAYNRHLGLEPETLYEIDIIEAKYGPCIRVGKNKECLFVGLKNKEQDYLDSITLEEAIELIKERREWLENNGKVDKSKGVKYKKYKKKY